MSGITKTLICAAAQLLLCGCLRNMVTESPARRGLVVAGSLSAEPWFALDHDAGTGRSFFAWAPVSGEPGARVAALSAGRSGEVEELPGAQPWHGGIQAEPLISVSSGSLYTRWIENSSGTLKLKAAVYDLKGAEPAKEFDISGLLSLVKDRGVITPSGGDSVFLAWQDFSPGLKVAFAGIAELGPGGVKWRRVLGNRTAREQYLLPAVIAGGDGGAFAAFRHIHDGDKGVVVRHFESGGAAWDDDVQAADVVGYKSGPKIASDSNGDIFVLWEDGRSGPLNVYAQKISSAGAVLWNADGVPLGAGGGNHWKPVLAPDGAGGFYCAWIDDNKGSKWELAIQRIDKDGAQLWGPGGVAVFASPGRQSEPSLVPDGEGGVILAWNETRYGYLDVFAQRFSPGGAGLWGKGGVPVTAANADQAAPRMAADGEGGCLIAWKRRHSGGSWEIKAQRLDPKGTPLWR